MTTAANAVQKFVPVNTGKGKAVKNAGLSKVIPFTQSITIAEEETKEVPTAVVETKTVEEVAPTTIEKTIKETAPTAQATQERRPLTMEELTDKAERLHLLQMKYKEIKDKRKQLENFSISHDNANAQLTLVDAKSLSISTSNPASINKLLVDWMADLNTHLAKVENDMRKQLEA